MPHFLNNVLVVTEAELVPSWYSTPAALRKEVSRFKNKPFGIKKTIRGGNGRQMMILFDSLHGKIKAALGDPRKGLHIMESYYKADIEAVTFFKDYRTASGEELALPIQEKYITNAQVLIACDLLKRERESIRRSLGGNLAGVMLTVCDDAYSFNFTLEAKYNCRHSLPNSAKRFRELYAEFVKPSANNYNYAALISRRLGNKNSAKKKISPKFS